jgi:hypothetical protein
MKCGTALIESTSETEAKNPWWRRP